MLLTSPAFAAQQTLTGGIGATHQWSVQKGRINDNFTELYGWTGQGLTTTSSPAFTAVSLGVASTTYGTLDLYGTTYANPFRLWTYGGAVPSVGWRLPSTLPAGTYLITSTVNGYLDYLDPATFLTPSGVGGALTVTATGFDGNLATTDNTVQEIAQKLDDLVATGSPADDTAYNATSWDANTDAATKNAIRDKIETLAGGHDAATINATANGLTITGQEIALGLASTSTIGALSDTDWDTFNNKVSYTPATPGAIGATTPAAGTFTTVTAASYVSSAADGSRYTILPNNASIVPLADGSEQIYNEGGQIKVVEADLEAEITTTIASGMVELNTTTVAASGVIADDACQLLASAQTATNALAASDGVDFYFIGDPTSKLGFAATGMLTLIPFVSADNAVQVRVCNQTGASITLNTAGNGATIKWAVRR